MILHSPGEPDITIGLHEKAGHRFNSIELTALDAHRLSQLSPEMLHEWLLTWMCGFKPIPLTLQT